MKGLLGRNGFGLGFAFRDLDSRLGFNDRDLRIRDSCFVFGEKGLGTVVKIILGSMFKFEALEMKSKFGQQHRV